MARREGSMRVLPPMPSGFKFRNQTLVDRHQVEQEFQEASATSTGIQPSTDPSAPPVTSSFKLPKIRKSAPPSELRRGPKLPSRIRRALGLSSRSALPSIPEDRISGHPDSQVPTKESHKFTGTGVVNLQDPQFGSPKIVGLNLFNFHTFTQGKEKALVMFYNSNERKTASLKKEFGTAADRSMSDSHGYAAVDCFVDKDVCCQKQITPIPMFKLYSNGFEVANVRDTKSFNAYQMNVLVKMTPVRNPTTFTNAEQPTNFTNTEQPTKFTDTEQPTTFTDTEQPMKFTDTEQPTTFTNTEQPMRRSRVIMGTRMLKR